MTESADILRGNTPDHLARIAKALAHPARVQILLKLMNRSTCMGCDFSDATGLAASTTSEHLRILKDAGLIEGRVEHPYICYTLAPSAVQPLASFAQRIAEASAPLLPEDPVS